MKTRGPAASGIDTRRRLLCALAFLAAVSALHAQESAEEENPPPDGIFPLTLVLEGAEYAGTQVWRPDWPLEIPPDAFTVPSASGPRAAVAAPSAVTQAEVSRITLESEGFLFELRYGDGGNFSRGRVEEFPFMLNGKMAQVGLVYEGDETPESSAALGRERGRPSLAGWDPPPVIREMTVTFPPEETEPEAAAEDTAAAGDAPLEGAAQGEEPAAAGARFQNDPWKLEFLEFKAFFPALVRASRGDAWYFIYLSGGVSEISETWYDEEGNFAGAYVFSLAETGNSRRIRSMRTIEGFSAFSESNFYYDEREFLTGISGPSGLFRVLYYRKDRQRYWERRPRELPAEAPAAQTPTADAPLSGTPDSTGIPEDSGAAAGNFSIEWDERGLIVRIRGITGEGDEAAGPVDYRYEYTLDELGNWVERREIRMIRVSGLLVPSPGTVSRRVLEYLPPARPPYEEPGELPLRDGNPQ